MRCFLSALKICLIKRLLHSHYHQKHIENYIFNEKQKQKTKMFDEIFYKAFVILQKIFFSSNPVLISGFFRKKSLFWPVSH
jgi:hypothetical protein